MIWLDDIQSLLAPILVKTGRLFTRLNTFRFARTLKVSELAAVTNIEQAVFPNWTPKRHHRSMVIGKRLRAVRQQQKLSLRDVEKRTKLQPSNLCKMEKNRRVPSLRTLKRLAKGLKVPLHELFHTGVEALQARHQTGRNGNWNPQEEARYLDKLLRLFDRIDDSDRHLLLSTANKMVRRRSTARDRR